MLYSSSIFFPCSEGAGEEKKESLSRRELGILPHVLELSRIYFLDDICLKIIKSISS